MQIPPHSTIAAFRRRRGTTNEAEFVSELQVCVAAGLVRARGDELTEQLRTRESRRAALKAAREKLERERAVAIEAGEEVIEKVEVNLDPERFEIRPEGRQAWLRQARRDVEAQRQANPWPVPRSRQERLVETKRRMDEELA